LAKHRPVKSAPPTAAGARLAPIDLDPLRLIWTLTALTLGVILAYSHAYPQGPFPLHGIVPSLGLVILAAAALLLVARTDRIGPLVLWPIALPTALLVWALLRTAYATVPTEGLPLLGTLLEGLLVFAVALVLAAVGKNWRALRLVEPPESASQPAAPAERLLLFDLLTVFLLALAVALALWALYQYFILYDQEFSDLYQTLLARQKDLSKLAPRDWAMLETLQSRRVGSRFGNPNVLAGFLAMIAPLALGAVFLWTDRSAKAVALAALGLIFYVVMLTNSRGGILTLVLTTAAAFVLLGRERWRRHFALLAIAGGLCLAAAALAIVTANAAVDRLPTAAETTPARQVRYSFFERLLGAPTVAQRFYYWESASEMIREAPLTGHGLGGYAVLYPRHRNLRAGETRHPHNILLHLWVETGLIGLLLWTAWVGAVLGRGLLRLCSRRREKADDFCSRRREKADDRLTAYPTTPAASPGRLALTMLLVAASAFLLNNLFEMTWVFRETYLDWSLILGVLAGLSWNASTPAPAKAHAAAPASRSLRIAALALAALPFATGAILADPILYRPLRAEAARLLASDLAMLPQLTADDIQEIERLARLAIRFQPRNPWYRHWLASFYRDSGRIREARWEYDKAIRLFPSSAAIHSDYALLEQKEKQYDRARALLTRAAQLYPLNPRYHYLLAELERVAGRREAARRHIQSALRLVFDARERARYEAFRTELLTTGTLVP